MSLGKCKNNSEIVLHTYYNGWNLKKKTLQYQLLARIKRNRKCHWLLVRMEHGTATLEDILLVSDKAKQGHSKWSNNYSGRYLPNIFENLCPPKISTSIFIVALFIVTPNWKKPRCPSSAKWINRMWYRKTMEYYPVIEENELPIHAMI